MSRITVCVSGLPSLLYAQPGENLLEVLRRSGVPVPAPCGGLGRCGKCTVLLKEADFSARPVLACHTTLTADCTVTVSLLEDGIIEADPVNRIPSAGSKEPLIKSAHPICGRFRTLNCVQNARNPQRIPVLLSLSGHKIASHFEHTSFNQRFPHSAQRGFGAAVDLGTTTLAVQLYRLQDGILLGTARAWNAQAAFGADVISRVQYTMQHSDGLAILADTVRKQLTQLLTDLCTENDLAPENITQISLAGNTIMQHLMAGLSPSGMAMAPYTPLTFFAEDISLQLPQLPAAQLQ